MPNTAKTLSVALIGILGCVSCASLPDPDDGYTYGTRLFMGGCYGKHSGGREAFTEALIANLITTGLDAVGTALKEAAAESKKQVTASINFEIPFVGAERYPECLQIVRGTFKLRPGEKDERWAPKGAGFSAPPGTNIVLAEGEEPEFFLEAQLISRKKHNGLAFAPTLLMFSKPLSNPTFSWVGGRNLSIDLKLQAVGGSAVTTSIDFGFVRTDAKMFLVTAQDGANPAATGAAYQAHAFEAPWVAVTASATPAPWTLTATLTETKPAEPALAFISGVFEKTKPALQTELEKATIEEKRIAAEAAALAARNTKLDAFDQKMTAAIAALGKCVKEPTLENAQAALAAQRRANEAGIVIGRTPYPNPMDIWTDRSKIKNACSDALGTAPG